jgi:hypothetical protein
MMEGTADISNLHGIKSTRARNLLYINTGKFHHPHIQANVTSFPNFRSYEKKNDDDVAQNLNQQWRRAWWLIVQGCYWFKTNQKS